MTTLFMNIYIDKNTPLSHQGRGNRAYLELSLRNHISITLLLIMVALSAGCAHRPDVPPSRQMGKP